MAESLSPPAPEVLYETAMNRRERRRQVCYTATAGSITFIVWWGHIGDRPMKRLSSPGQDLVL